MTPEELAALFSGPAAISAEVQAKHDAVRAGALAFAQILAANCPAADLAMPLEKCRDAMLVAVDVIHS